MLRSFLLFLLTKPEIGITAWVDELYRVPLYAILSGFEPGDVPGVGTFYDFFARLWATSSKSFKPLLPVSISCGIREALDCSGIWVRSVSLDSARERFWKLVYKRRTTVERTNKRDKID